MEGAFVSVGPCPLQGREKGLCSATREVQEKVAHSIALQEKKRGGGAIEPKQNE